MVMYTIAVKSKEDNKLYNYSLDLNQNQEDNPPTIFTSEIITSMQRQLESQSLCKINSSQLQQIINAWIEDIREGYRNTQITLKIKSAREENLKLLQDRGNQELPNLIEPNLDGIEPTYGMLPPLESIIQS